MTIIQRHRAELRRRIIAALSAHLAAHPPARAERVILFGSLARGDFDGASDADLLVVGDTLPDPSIHDAAGRAVDLLLWRPGQWQAAVEEGHPFIRELRASGVELWRAPGVAPLHG